MEEGLSKIRSKLAERQLDMDVNMSTSGYFITAAQNAKNGDTNAMVFIGAWYEEEGDFWLKMVPKIALYKYEMAYEFYSKACELKNSLGMMCLGRMYEEGKGALKDIKKAIEFYQQAANIGNIYAAYNLALIYVADYYILEDMEEKVIMPIKSFIESGDSSAINNTGCSYEKQGDIEKSKGNLGEANQFYTQAVEFYRWAVRYHNNIGITNLARMFEEGKGVDRNINIAIKLYEIAVTLGNLDAMVNLGRIYVNGYGVPKNIPVAIQLFEQASEFGNIDAKCNLALIDARIEGIISFDKIGLMYKTLGDVISKIMPGEATELYQISARFGNTDARRQFELINPMTIPYISVASAPPVSTVAANNPSMISPNNPPNSSYHVQKLNTTNRSDYGTLNKRL